MISSLITASLLFFSLRGPLRHLELRGYDLMMYFARFPLENHQVVLVEYDEATLQKLPEARRPISSDLLARAIRNLMMAGTKKLLIDMPFEGPYRVELDSTLLETLHEYRNSIVAGVRHDVDISLLDLLERRELPYGWKEYVKDPDGFVRNVSHGFSLQGRMISPLATMAGPISTRSEENIHGGIVFRREPSPFPRFTFADVLDDSSFQLATGDIDFMNRPASGNPFLKKIVLLGITVPGMQNRLLTPFFQAQDPVTSRRNRDMPRLQVHAHAVATNLEGAWINRAHFFAALFYYTLIAGCGILLGSIGKPGWTAILIVPVGALLILFSFRMFAGFQTWYPLVTPLVVLVVTYLVNMVYRQRNST